MVLVIRTDVYSMISKKRNIRKKPLKKSCIRMKCKFQIVFSQIYSYTHSAIIFVIEDSFCEI